MCPDPKNTTFSFFFPGLWSQVSGLRSLVSGLRSQVSGLRSRVSGLGSRVSGLRSLVSGLKSQVSGLKVFIGGPALAGLNSWGPKEVFKGWGPKGPGPRAPNFPLGRRFINKLACAI